MEKMRTKVLRLITKLQYYFKPYMKPTAPVSNVYVNKR